MIIRISLDRLADVVPLFDAYRVFYKQESDMDRAREFLEARLSGNESVIFVAYQKDVAVGFTQLYPVLSSMRTSKNWVLNDLYVDAKARGQGVGEGLIKKALAFAKQEGATFVRLSTQVENVTAQRLYRKMGFQMEDPDTEFLTFTKTALQ